MKRATTVIQLLVRLVGLAVLVLGVLFWTGNALQFLPVHMLLGLALVILLWALAGLAARAGVHPGAVALAIGWGLLVPALGITQSRLLPGSAHWVIQALHLLVGLGAIGQAEGLARRIARAQAPAAQPGDIAAPSIGAR
ncbi:MAG: hypothetical protein IPO81_06055 [Kouleothrix sp.]|nr:hypothetical protein [Kouleothrix sp.]